MDLIDATDDEIRNQILVMLMNRYYNEPADVKAAIKAQLERVLQVPF